MAKLGSWYVRQSNGQEYGPHTWEEILAYARGGIIKHDSKIKCPFKTNNYWVDVMQNPEIASLLPQYQEPASQPNTAFDLLVPLTESTYVPPRRKADPKGNRLVSMVSSAVVAGLLFWFVLKPYVVPKMAEWINDIRNGPDVASVPAPTPQPIAPIASPRPVDMQEPPNERKRRAPRTTPQTINLEAEPVVQPETPAPRTNPVDPILDRAVRTYTPIQIDVGDGKPKENAEDDKNFIYLEQPSSTFPLTETDFVMKPENKKIPEFAIVDGKAKIDMRLPPTTRHAQRDYFYEHCRDHERQEKSKVIAAERERVRKELEKQQSKKAKR